MANRQDYQIDANDQLVTSNDLSQRLSSPSANGAPVMLTDVAKILDGVENTSQAAWMNKNRPAVIVNGPAPTRRVTPSASSIALRHFSRNSKSNLPKGIDVTTLTDLTTPIQAFSFRR